jgi:DNA polymerase-3 subunit alpha (Gram-positive type)
MDGYLSRFLDCIGFPVDLRDEFQDGYFKNLHATNAQNNIVGDLYLPKFLSYKTLKEFLSIIDAFAKDKTRHGFTSNLTYHYQEEPDENVMRDFINDYIEDNDYYQLDNFSINIKTRSIVFEYMSVGDAAALMGLTSNLETMLTRASFKPDISFGLVENQEEGIDNSIDEAYSEDAEKQAKVNKLDQMEADRQKTLDSTYIPCKIKDAATQKMKRVEVTGTVFALEMREVKNHTKQLLIISYTDNSYSIVSNLFESKKFDRAFLASIKEGSRVQIKGSPMFDDYAKQMTIRVDELTVLPPLPKRMDDYPGEKRIELHLHTKMSAMDGVADSSAYFETAHRWGWKAIGVTDHGAVSAFPQYQDANAKFPDVKPLYGTELYMVDDKLSISFNPVEKPLKDMTYVVFDLETIGLSCRYGRIIEFGGVKYKNGTTLDRRGFYVNPDRPLSEATKKLTGITDEQVKGGLPIKQALKEILAFFGDATLVAHNGTFDFGFINEALRNNGLAPLTNPVIDTLPLSRYLFPDLKSHSLGAIVKKVGASYDEDEAHDAVYDAEVLLSAWSAMEGMLMNTDPNMTHAHLNTLFNDQMILNAPHPYHICVYVKNSVGLKNLFRIISDSNIKYFHDVPRVPRSLITQYRADFLLGSACFNGEVFDAAMTKSEEYTKKVMEYYDYIEVQPPCEYDFLVNTGQLESMDDVYKILKDMVKMAKDVNKPVVATSDAHYINIEDRIYRDVFVFAPGLKGTRHPLNPYKPNREKMKYFDNPDQHLRTTQEMLDEFSFLGDDSLVKEIVIDNTHKIADQISSDIHPIHKSLSTPTIDNCDVLLREKVYSRAKELYGDPLPKPVQDRIDAEMKGISDHHYEVIYWIAAKIVNQAHDAGFIVGSRGSVGSSIVATMSGITEVNPLPPHYRCPFCKHTEFIDDPNIQSGFDLPEKKCPVCGAEMVHDGQNIPFATFIGFKADKTPDIDLNFPPDYQPIAHELTKKLLTEESGNHVYKAGTIESVQENTAIGYAKGYFESLEKHPELGIKADEVSKAELMRISRGCIDVKRTTGQHPGGIIVIPRGMDVYDFTPIQYPADKPEAGWETSHFDFNQMHDTILKLDLLGHVDPQALRMMGQLSGVDVFKIPLNDKETMSLFANVDALHLRHNYLNDKVGTRGLPEFGTDFVMNLIYETKPKSYNDLLIIEGLAHGTNVYNGNQQDLIKNGVTDLRGVIGCRDDIMMTLHYTYGIDLEDSFKIMEIVRHGKFLHPKNPGDREKYMKEMLEHKVPQYYIDSCDKIQYLFPRAHAVAYSMSGFRVGWFKVHEPLTYYATYFTFRCTQFDLSIMCAGEGAVLSKLQELSRIPDEEHRKLKNPELELQFTLQSVLEMYDRGFTFEKLSINRSQATAFTIDKDHNALIPPFSAIAGVGESVAQSIVQARSEGAFTSVDDLLSRTRISHQKVDELRDLGALEGLPETDQITLF